MSEADDVMIHGDVIVELDSVLRHFRDEWNGVPFAPSSDGYLAAYAALVTGHSQEQAIVEVADKIGEVADKIGDVADKIGEVAEKSDEVADKIGEVVDKIGEVAHKIGEVADKTDEVVDKTDDVARAIASGLSESAARTRARE